jgi:hypothetical protein
MLELLEHLDDMATEFCELHDITCCTRKDYKHSHYQCKHNSDPIIVCYREIKFSCPDIEQAKKYIAYVAAHEINFLIDTYFETFFFENTPWKVYQSYRRKAKMAETTARRLQNSTHTTIQR